MGYIVLQTRITEGNRVWETTEADTFDKAIDIMNECWDMVGKCHKFTLPFGCHNSTRQGYVDGDFNDAFFLDILDKGNQSVDFEGRIHTMNNWLGLEEVVTVGGGL